MDEVLQTILADVHHHGNYELAIHWLHALFGMQCSAAGTGSPSTAQVCTHLSCEL